jgi:hypothetical protein
MDRGVTMNDEVDFATLTRIAEQMLIVADNVESIDQNVMETMIREWQHLLRMAACLVV